MTLLLRKIQFSFPGNGSILSRMLHIVYGCLWMSVE